MEVSTDNCTGKLKTDKRIGVIINPPQVKKNLEINTINRAH